MKIEFKNAKDFYKLLNFISQWQKEIQVVCTPEKLSILTMSQCCTVFITCELPSEYFNLYQCNPKNKEREEIGLNLDVVLSALKQSTPKDRLQMSIPEPKPNKEADTVIFSILKPDGDCMEFEIKQMTLTIDSLDIPPMEEDCTVKLHPLYLKKWKAVADFTKASIKFTPNPKGLTVESECNILGSVKASQPIPSVGIEYERYSDDCQSISIGGQNVSKCLNIGDVSNDISFGYKNGLPIRFEASMGTGFISVYTAPMIGDEMEED